MKHRTHVRWVSRREKRTSKRARADFAAKRKPFYDWLRFGNVYVSLHTEEPRVGDGSTEVSYTEYARQEMKLAP